MLLSGHAGVGEIGRGAFQELRQADMAAPVTKASWVARSAATLGTELADAVRIAVSGRPGPVHLSLPFDLLEERVEDQPRWAAPLRLRRPDSRRSRDGEAAATRWPRLAEAKRPLVLAGPQLCHARRLALLPRSRRARRAGRAMESPRGINDPWLGAFAEVLRQADLILLLGKALDFTLRFADPPFVDAACRFVVIEPEPP